MRQEYNTKMYKGVFSSVCRQNPTLPHEKAKEIAHAITARKLKRQAAHAARREEATKARATKVWVWSSSRPSSPL